MKRRFTDLPRRRRFISLEEKSGLTTFDEAAGPVLRFAARFLASRLDVTETTSERVNRSARLRIKGRGNTRDRLAPDRDDAQVRSSTRRFYKGIRLSRL